MKAIRVREFGPPEVMQLEELPTPTPGPGELVMRIKAAGVSPLHALLRAGFRVGDYPMDLPLTPGFDAAGVVERVGVGVNRFRVGDRVYGTSLHGCYAEYGLFNESKVYPLPSTVTFAQAAGMRVPYLSAFYSLFSLARAEPGETVLVQGASGAVGTAAVQLAKAYGLIAIGTAGTEAGRSTVLREGAVHAIDYRAADLWSQVAARTHGRGVDIILETFANQNLVNGLESLAKNGRMVILSGPGKTQFDPLSLIAKGTRIMGLDLLSIPPAESARIHLLLNAGMETGVLRPLVPHEMPLADAPAAHRALESGEKMGRFALMP